jgi:AbrB family looped-hinge helix DNA binding protein
MPRVTTKGQVTIPKEIREELGIEPGDEVVFEPIDGGYEIRKEAPTTETGEDPFEKYRGSAESDETMPQRMRRLRGEYPRTVGGESGTDESDVPPDPEDET